MTTSTQNSAEIQELKAILAVLEAEEKAQGNGDPILAVIIQMLTELLASLGGDQTPQTPTTPGNPFVPQPKVNPGSGPTNSQMSNAVAQLAEALAELQVLLGKYGQEKNTMENNNMQSMVQEAQAFLKQAQDQLQKIEDQQSSHHWWDIFLKVITAIVGAVFALIACATGQVALAVVIIALTVAAETGAFGEATKLISQALQAMGVPAKDANIIASVIVIVATIVLTIATCGAAAPEAAADVAGTVADTAAEAAETAAETAAEETTEVTAETAADQGSSVGNTLKNIGNTLKNGFMKVIDATFGKLPASVNMSILTGSQAVMQTNLANNIIAAIPNLSDKQRQELEKIIGIIVDILCSLASLGAGFGVAAGSAATSAESAFSPAVMKGLIYGGFAGQGASALGNFEIASIDAKEAELELSLGSDESFVSLFQNMSKIVESAITSGTKFDTSTQKAHTEELTALQADLAKAGQALANVLSA
ncbi:MAG: hypothetical protein JSR93_08530 [Verrucomicrobia bacterium]|nr:hypothetical protein [Verrucomicrobiota bacterium]